MIAQLESSDRLRELIPALRALEVDHMGVAPRSGRHSMEDCSVSAMSMIGTAVGGTKQESNMGSSRSSTQTSAPVLPVERCVVFARLVSVAKLVDFEQGWASYADFIGITVLPCG
jgi:hypothetical protein